MDLLPANRGLISSLAEAIEDSVLNNPQLSIRESVEKALLEKMEYLNFYSDILEKKGMTYKEAEEVAKENCMEQLLSSLEGEKMIPYVKFSRISFAGKYKVKMSYIAVRQQP